MDLVTTILKHTRIADDIFEMSISRPSGYEIEAGQYVFLELNGIRRAFSPSAVNDPDKLKFLVKIYPGGSLTPLLAESPPGTELLLSPPQGHFTFHDSPRPSVFISTGAGIAPFISMVRSGIKPVWLIQGATNEDELLYSSELSHARVYRTACVTVEKTDKKDKKLFKGRVTDYLDSNFPFGEYNFYLCGGNDVVNDTAKVIQRRFPESRIYAEAFSA